MGGVRKAQGFALMIVISLLTVVSSLIVGFALLSNLENKKISNTFHSPALIAKQNALHALNEALAKLQATSGQDTVATAKADILGTATADNRHWVGVWKINKCDEKDVGAQDQKHFLTWLVSGNYYNEGDCAMAIETSRRISIINPKYENIAPAYVQLVDAADSNGQYAYWIDDQSLKIQGNIYDSGNSFRDLLTTSSISPAAYYYTKRQCQRKYGLSMLTDYANCPLTQQLLNEHKDIQGEVNYTNLLDSSAISEQQNLYLQNKFHDLTNLSLGLLTDTRNGGFRKNLRHQTTNFLNEIPDNAFIFQPPTTLPAPPTTWGYLKSFFNINAGGSLTPQATNPLYRPQSGVNYSGCAMSCTTANGYTTGTISGTNGGDLGIATQYGIYPIWMEFKSYAALYYYKGYTPDNSSTTGRGYYQSLRLQPAFYFENPYAYDLATVDMKIGQWAPYVTNPENNGKERYQKQPTFRCKIFYNDGTSDDGLYQNYPNSENDGNKVFPFLNIDPDKYMRPIWDGAISTNYVRASAKYIKLNAYTSYIATGKIKPLANGSNDPRDSVVNDIRFYQSEVHRDMTGSSCWMESYPSPNSADWNGTWQNDTDQWTLPCLRTTDGSGNILQQICDIEMNHTSLGADRNFTCNNLSSWYNKESPLYLTCISLRRDPSTTSNYWHQYAANGIGVRPLVEANPCAPISSRTAHQDDMTSPSYSANFIPGNWSWCAHWLGLSNGNSETCSHSEHIPFVEHPEFRNLFDLPESNYRLLNLGFLQHMNVGCFSYHPTYAFGNSHQNPHIPREKFFQENSSITGSTWPSHCRVEMLYDYSYCLNRALWDSYFIASNNSGNGFYLLNPRQKAFTGTTQNAILSFKDAAENMAIHGAFNVNSTSVDAWTAFLGSTIGNLTEDESYAEYSRIQTINSTADVGLRQLNQGQVKTLAEKVVEQIKWRGIAGSIGEFVNRRLIAKDTDTHKLGLKGALQAAIDGTTINDGQGGSAVTSNRNKTWFDDEAASGPFWACKPGYLTQADILQSTATTLCARGDTFCIHAYGNALDTSGAIEAEMRCEAIVQRLPELLDSSKPELGRKYKILAIKWITPPLRINSPISGSMYSDMYSDYFSNISDAWKRREAARSAGDRAYYEAYYCDEYWVIGNMAENMNNMLIDFLNNADLNALASNLDYHIADKEWQYSKRFSDPVTGAFNAATWNAYQTLRDFVKGNATKADVQKSVNDALSAIDGFLSNDPNNQQEFQNAVDSLNATAATTGDINDQTNYAQGYQGSTHTGGAQAAGSLLGLGTIEHFLSLF